MAILGLDAINRFFEALNVGLKAWGNIFAVLGLTVVYVAVQLIFIAFYIRIIRALMGFKPKVDMFINRLSLWFED
jgi:hypothetical protein